MDDRWASIAAEVYEFTAAALEAELAAINKRAAHARLVHAARKLCDSPLATDEEALIRLLKVFDAPSQQATGGVNGGC